jgi:class 3 adenylate cyclase
MKLVMGELQSKRFEEPDEIVSLPNLNGQVVVLGETYIGRYTHQPGWRWSKDVKPLVGTPSCQIHHQGVILSGHMQITTNDGAQRIIGPGEAFDIPPGHDGCTIGEEPVVSIEFRGVRDWAKPNTASGRILATLLFTDIVGSTAIASKIGDTAWKQLLAQHYDRVRLELERFHGYEVKTTGDGILAIFDGAARSVNCASRICSISKQDGIEVRAGIHTGEVERFTDSVQGVAVHMAARVMALAEAGEVWLSAPTVALLEGSGLTFSDAGEYELKGFEGARRLYRLNTEYSESPKNE